MSKEKQNNELVQMYRDLCEVFDEEYKNRRLITPQNTAEKMTAKGYRKQSEGEWIVTKTEYGWNCAEYPVEYTCSVCGRIEKYAEPYCPNCGARMTRKEDEGK